ncbi:hypothetical protein [Oceanobacter antarcticus]|uniref:Uncharacterized protein n=1 Tax=Oceanobacter antarcticus TaxID=3133425 RepID=A0ABW8NNL2_9GAMM
MSLMATPKSPGTITGVVAERLAEEADRIAAMQQALLAELAKMDLMEQGSGIMDAFDVAEIRIDPYDQTESLQCYWKTPLGMNQGSMQLRPGGQLFAEYDVLCVHPQKPAWFIEAVTGWGRPGAIRTELRLIPLP